MSELIHGRHICDSPASLITDVLITLSLWDTELHWAPCFLPIHLSRPFFHKHKGPPLPQDAVSPIKGLTQEQEKSLNNKKNHQKDQEMVFKYFQSGLISLLSILFSLKFAGCQVSKMCSCKGVWVPQLKLSSCNSAESGFWIRVPKATSQCDL